MKRRLNIITKPVNNVTKNGTGILMLFLLLVGFSTCSQQVSIINKNHQEIESGQKGITLKSDNALLYNYSIPLKRLLDSFKVDNSELCIHIDKSDYALSFYADTLLIKQYPVVFGGNPVDDKLHQGDGCTPEGSFKVLAKYDHAAWTKFIWIDYPNKESLVKFREAKANGIISPESTPGGEIGIHGVYPNRDINIDERNNWTAGCISLKNKDIGEIYEYVNVGTRVFIRK